MDALRCEDLRKSFGGVNAVAGVTLVFPTSGISAIIGPNGAGKTTLLNVLTGFLRAETGRCILGAREITHMAPHRIARLGVSRTFQDLRLIQQVSLFDNVMTASPNQRGERLLLALTRIGVKQEETHNAERVMELLRFVGLAEKAQEPACELSYGQQKLLALAVCLATQARLLLLDEPVAGVAPEMVKQIVGLLRQLRDAGNAIVFIEHDIEVVRQTDEWVIVMDEGKVIAQGPALDVLERPEIMEAYLG